MKIKKSCSWSYQDISTGLSRSSKKLNIIKLNNITEDLEKIAEKSSARYLISGDLRSSANNIRVSMNLIDAATMKTAWSENFDRKADVTNIFQLQDDIVSTVLLMPWLEVVIFCLRRL